MARFEILTIFPEFFRGFFEHRVAQTADGALHVFELDDGYARAGGGLESRGVMHLGSLLGVGWKNQRGYGKHG